MSAAVVTLLRRAFEAAHDSRRPHVRGLQLRQPERRTSSRRAIRSPKCSAKPSTACDSREKARFGFVVDIITAQLGLIRTLRGLTPRFGSFDDEQFDEARFERHLSANPALALPECWYWIRKLQARFFAGDYASAVDAAARARRLLWVATAAVRDGGIPLLRRAGPRRTAGDAAPADAATAAPRGAGRPPRPARGLGGAIAPRISRTAPRWSAPRSRASKAASSTPMRLYEQAIRSARANGFVHNEALANELAARFYAARGFETIAAGLSAQRPLLLPPLGRRWQGAATRCDSIRTSGRTGQRPVRRARSGRRSNTSTSRP